MLVRSQLVSVPAIVQMQTGILMVVVVHFLPMHHLMVNVSDLYTQLRWHKPRHCLPKQG